MEVSIDHENTNEIQFFKNAFWFVCKYFNIEKEDYTVNVAVTDICDGNNGMLFDHMEENRFDILIQSGRGIGNMIMVLIHELIHVKQFIKNCLTSTMDCTIPYLERWWEIEAFELTPIITNEFINFIQ